MYQGRWLNLPFFHYRLVFCAKLGIAFVLLHLDEHSQKKILCSFSGTGWLPSTTELYKAPTCPALIRCADLFWLQTSFSWLFWRRAGKQLRRVWEDMLQQTSDSACHCCLIVKYLSQLHKQFISSIPLVQFNRYCEHGGDNDEALTWTRDLINLFFPKDVYRRSLFFFLALPARSHELADVFEKNEKKKIKQGLLTG